jgi:hypothetical protein
MARHRLGDCTAFLNAAADNGSPVMFFDRCDFGIRAAARYAAAMSAQYQTTAVNSADKKSACYSGSK